MNAKREGRERGGKPLIKHSMGRLIPLPMHLLESLTLTRANRVQLSLLGIQLPERDKKQRPDHPRGNPERSINPNKLVLRAHRREGESQSGRNGVLELSEGRNETLHLFWRLKQVSVSHGERGDRVDFRMDRSGAYLGEGKLERSDRREDLSNTQ